MKANEYIKKYGIEVANRAVSECTYGYGVDLIELKRLVESYELIERVGGLDRVKKALDGKHIGYTHFYLHSNDRYVFLDHYVDFIPDRAQHIGMFNKTITDVESCL